MLVILCDPFQGGIGDWKEPQIRPQRSIALARVGRKIAVGGVRLRLADTKQLLLCRPRDRKVYGPDQTMGGQLRGLPSRGDRLDNIRSQEGERQQAADVPIADSFDSREFGDTADPPRDERLQTAVSAPDLLQQNWIGLS